MNIFIRELKANRKALIIWSICMIFVVASGMGKYTAYASGGESLNAAFSSIPSSMKALLGFGSFDLTKMSNYYAMLFIYMELVTAIHAVLLGAGIIAKEEKDRTTEFLMIKPVSRKNIITAKLLAAFVNVLVVNLVSLITSVALVGNYSKGENLTGELVTLMVSMLIVQSIFLSLGAALAALSRNPKSSGSLATGILMAGFVISKITDMTDKVNFLNVFSPFKYFSLEDVVNGNGLNPGIVVLSLLLTTVFSVLTYIYYQKRDLRV